MLFTLVFLGILIVPGYLLCEIMRISEYRLLFIATLSYFVFILLATVAWLNSLTVVNFAILYSIIIIVLFAYVCICRNISQSRALLSEKVFSAKASPVTMGILFFAICIYHWFFGIYDEMPADVYKHLDYTTQSFQRLGRGGFGGSVLSLKYIFSGGIYWYQLIAWTSHLSRLSIFESFPIVMVISTTWFLMAVGLCADRIFRAFNFSHKHHQLAMILSVFFVLSQMGLNVFSYIRYYSLAPTMINFVVYFAGLVCLLDLFENKGRVKQSVALLAISLMVAIIIHQQEGLFILVAGWLLLGWRCIAQCWNNRKLMNRVFIYSLITLFALILVALTVYAWVRFNYGLGEIYHNKVIPLPFIGRFLILDPGYQFIWVVTIWGLLVYTLFAANFKKFLVQPFLILGMFSPVFTVFNPLFVEIFVRTNQASTLWRLCYFIPLHFCAAVLTILFVKQIKLSSPIKKLTSVTGIALLFLLLLPGIGSFPINAYAKITLGKVKKENQVSIWKDLIDYMNTVEKSQRVFVDPVTAYMLNSLTLHYSYNYKFIPSSAYYRNSFVFDSYDDFPLSKYSGRLLIINTRNGGKSRSGELSGHWHKDILKVSDYYPENLLEHLEEHPNRFEKRWSADRISVYYIK